MAKIRDAGVVACMLFAEQRKRAQLALSPFCIWWRIRETKKGRTIATSGTSQLLDLIGLFVTSRPRIKDYTGEFVRFQARPLLRFFLEQRRIPRQRRRLTRVGVQHRSSLSGMASVHSAAAAPYECEPFHHGRSLGQRGPCASPGSALRRVGRRSRETVLFGAYRTASRACR